MRYTPSGQGVCEMRIATSESWNDKNGQRQERAEWHRVVVWGKQAEHCAKYLSKGRQVYVEGRIQTRSYDDKEGNKRYITEVIANNVQFLGGARRRRRRRWRWRRRRDDWPPASGALRRAERRRRRRRRAGRRHPVLIGVGGAGRRSRNTSRSGPFSTGPINTT